MDIIAHGLWAGALFRVLKFRWKKLSVLRAVLWGLLPDLFTFTIPFVFVIIGGFYGADAAHRIFSESSPIFGLTMILYGISHSIFIFLIVFLLAYFIFKRFVWVMGGWLLHIFVDILSHEYGEWATPYLWPFPSPIFDGVAWWRNGWVVILNYSLLLAVYLYIFFRIIKKKK